FLLGLSVVLILSFIYFYSADRSILKNLKPLFENAKDLIAQLQPEPPQGLKSNALLHSEWFLDSFWRVRRCRDVSHYSQELMDKVFKRHHFAAVISVIITYLFLIGIGFFLDYK